MNRSNSFAERPCLASLNDVNLLLVGEFGSTRDAL